MKIRELIEYLQKYDQNMPVFVGLFTNVDVNEDDEVNMDNLNEREIVEIGEIGAGTMFGMGQPSLALFVERDDA